MRTVIVEYERALSLIGFRIGKDRSNSLASKKNGSVGLLSFMTKLIFQ